jgi:hypothetical protein
MGHPGPSPEGPWELPGRSSSGVAVARGARATGLAARRGATALFRETEDEHCMVGCGRCGEWGSHSMQALRRAGSSSVVRIHSVASVVGASAPHPSARHGVRGQHRNPLQPHPRSSRVVGATPTGEYPPMGSNQASYAPLAPL